MKIEAEYELMKKQRKLNFENLFNKYKNRKFELNLQQKQEKNLTTNNNLFKASKVLFVLFVFIFSFRNYNWKIKAKEALFNVIS